MGTEIAKWGQYDVGTAEKEREEAARQDDSAGFLKLKQGRNVLRALPPPLGKSSPWVTVAQHYIDVPGKAKVAAFNCPKTMAPPRSCRACETAARLKASGNDADYEAAKGFFARRRAFINVIDRDNPDAGPQILAISKGVHEKMLALRADTVAGGDYTDPVRGFDIVIDKQGEKLATTYEVYAARSSSPLGNLEWIAQQHDLSRYQRVLSDREIDAMLGTSATGKSPAAAGGARPTRTAEDDVIDTTGEPSPEGVPF